MNIIKKTLMLAITAYLSSGPIYAENVKQSFNDSNNGDIYETRNVVEKLDFNQNVIEKQISSDNDSSIEFYEYNDEGKITEKRKVSQNYVNTKELYQYKDGRLDSKIIEFYYDDITGEPDGADTIRYQYPKNGTTKEIIKNHYEKIINIYKDGKLIDRIEK